MSVLRKATKAITIGIMALIIVTLMLATWLLNSESGLRWALNQASNIIQVAEIKGDASDLSFSNLSVELDGTRIDIASGNLKWTLFDLINKQININTLQLNGVNVKLASSAEPSESAPYEPWQGIQLPVDISINDFALKQFKLSSNGDELLNLSGINTQLTLNNNVLTVSQLDVAQGNNTIKLDGSIDLSAKNNGVVSLNNQVYWSVGDQLIDTEGSLNGTWGSINLNQNTQLPFANDLLINIGGALAHDITWDGSITTHANTVVTKDNQTINLSQGQFEVSGGFSPKAGLASLVAKIGGGIRAKATLDSGTNNSNGDTNDTEQTLAQWEISTDLEFTNNILRVHQLALTEESNNPEKSDELGRLELSGSISDIDQFVSAANSSSDSVDTKTISSQANLSGDWYNLGFPLDKSNQQIITSGKLRLVGVPQDFAITANATGTAYSKPLFADIDIHIVDRITNVRAFTVNSGDSRINATGTIAEKLALNWSLNSPNLAELLPGSSGDLISQGSISGERESPSFNASAKSNGIIYGDTKLQQLDVVAQGSLADRSHEINIKASLETVFQGSSELARNLELSIVGTGEQHVIKANSVLFGQSNFSLLLNGGLNNGGWLGQLSKLSLDDPTYKHWHLSEPVNIKSENATFSANNACLSNQSQQVCLTANSDKTGVAINGKVTEVKLANLNPLLNLYDIRLSGQIDGDFGYAKKTNQTYSNLSAELTAQQSTLAVKKVRQEPHTFHLDAINIELDQQESLAAKALFVLQNGDRVSADIAVDSNLESSDFNSADLRGRIVAQLSDLSEFQAVTAPIKGLQGSLDADINLGGRINSPTVGMQTRLKQGELEIPKLGLTLSDIDLNATSIGRQNIEVSGHLSSGEGNLTIDGKLDFATLNEPRFALNLQGDNLELMSTHEIHVDGNVDANIVITQDLIELNGAIDLLQADLDFQLPEAAVLASQDVVLIGEEVEQKSTPQKINLTINLGRKTHINSQGLDAFLTGELQILQDPNEVMRANGQIDIKDGRYAAYNQNLEIDKGQLVYNGGVIDDPNLELRAQKEVDEITAGVSVTGRASSPLLQLYSTPSMSDEDVLSVLIFGKPISNLDSQDGFTLLKIANSLRGDGTKKSKISSLTESVQDSLGLSHLELQLEGNSPSVEAGKQLSSQLYVGYGYGLLDAVQSLVLRYKISRAWSIQGDVGADSGADLRYQIQR